MIGLHAIRGLLLMTSSWVRKHQQAVIEYLLEENRVLLEQRNGRRLVLTDDQRCRLAAKGNVIGRRDLKQVATIVKADTVLAWHRKLIEKSCPVRERRPGRPRVQFEIRGLVVRMALENTGWGYRRIQGELKVLSHRIARSTIAEILRENGVKPAPDRSTSWMTFIKAHWGSATESPTAMATTSERSDDGEKPHGRPSSSETVKAARGSAGNRGPRARSCRRRAWHVSQFEEWRPLERDRLLFDRQPRAA